VTLLLAADTALARVRSILEDFLYVLLRNERGEGQAKIGEMKQEAVTSPNVSGASSS